ncbi:Crp/Fnr family transcriptional regulator [Telluribacter sp. SYSU D00476]|uniref:Crp/Fnr family transcriptional regulator n=1 Tax=Telluribacter sp. SYSU D00476 TaxID=2811430 RepID=UPI001FF1BAA4|nr:Crp/Fnr family transcriptional regulator [Telluribacter sp. SYSU D00476]
MADTVDHLLQSFGISSSTSKQLFREQATIIELPKNVDIFIEGKKNYSEYLMISGVAHRYNNSDKGDSVTTGFYLSHSVITPHFARTSEGKSLFSLQTLTDAVLAEIPVEKLDELRTTNKEFRDFGQRVVERELSTAVLVEVALRSFSAKERLIAMRKQYPNLENLIPHHVIASYLGITHVSFSRLRSELSRE